MNSKLKHIFLISLLTDKQAIETNTAQQEFERTYQAFEQFEGMVKEPITDASITVDKWVYGDD